MGKKKKNKAAARASAAAGPAKKKQKKLRHNDRRITPGPLPPGVVARIPAPVITSKHRTYLEFVENKDKKKKLEFEVTTAREPPPGFEFVPVGNPDLAQACKELSREQDAMIFIVSDSREADATQLGIHMNRVGHHIRRTIVEEARAQLGQPLEYFLETVNGHPEPIPESQEEINAQADGVIRDLFPRMPNTDRQMIIDHSFRKGHQNRTVGLAANITLSRRVQLAVLAHIRHTHTRYDQLLREVGWSNARKAVESVCLDFLVKWRGDEETGRDQLDEILREIIVISDSEDSDTDSDGDSDASDDDISDDSRPGTGSRGSISSDDPPPTDRPIDVPDLPEAGGAVLYDDDASHDSHLRRPVHRRLNSRNVQRYEAAAQTRWQQARERVRHEPAQDASASRPVAAHQSGAPGQMDQQRAREGSRQPFDLYGRPSVPRDHHNPPDYRESQEVQMRASLPPVAGSEPVPIYRRNYYHPVTHGVIPVINEHENPVDYGVPRSTAERPELKDYLVPSIEPMSPQAGDSSIPIFVRSLPPRPQQQQSQLLRRPSVNDQAVRRRSRSPMDRVLHHTTVPYLARERDPLPSRVRPDDDHHLENARVPYGSNALPPRGGLERHMEPLRLRSPSHPGHIPREVHRAGPGDSHFVAYSRALPTNDPRPVMRTETRVAGPDYQESRVLRTDRHPIVVEDWEPGAQRVLLVPSRRVHPEHTPYLKHDGDVRMQHDGSRVPVITLDGHSHRRTPPHAQAARVGAVRYEHQLPRDYAQAPGGYSQHGQPLHAPPAPARPPSPLFYERVHPDDQRQHPAAAGGFAGRYGNGFSAINVDRDGHRTSGRPYNDQSFPVHNHSGYLPRTHSPNEAGGVPRPHHPPVTAPQRGEYIQLD
ncbi:hypothetical protein MAPG_09717 [Magnaporthiopsis poae ATCC 64411]|uniref:DUF2293 domain-containing protein n=1 Tax=Magnaporthiopsis poae (strain ATCC 64411 / 73-15) TaxID=644358 RepID=A0A0C4EAP0_MAGP6|nr:hypothetical protein MAPG_09717 [Magnaporthiopsis poae ATCC 64411]